MAALYTKAADRKTASSRAMNKLQGTTDEQSIPPPIQRVALTFDEG